MDPAAAFDEFFVIHQFPGLVFPYKLHFLAFMMRAVTNLVRVTDILSELTRQLGPLERQSETARIYLAKRDTLRELDVNCFLVENEKTSQELKELDGKNTRAAEELEENQKALSATRTF